MVKTINERIKELNIDEREFKPYVQEVETTKRKYYW